jgi:hypothetical protein
VLTLDDKNFAKSACVSMSVCYNEKRIQSLQGGVKVPTGGYSPRAFMAGPV